MDSTVSLLVEVPEVLHNSVQVFMDARPDWDQDRIFAVALSLFLLQNRTEADGNIDGYRQASRIYLDGLFKKPAEQIEPENKNNSQ